MHVARAQLRHDRLADASTTVERALALAHRNQQPLVALHELRATIRLRQLDADGALSDAEAAEKLARLRDIPHTPSVLALIRYYRGDFAERPEAPVQLDAERTIAAARAHAASGDAERAKELLQQVAADAGRGGALRLRDEAARELRRLGTRVAARHRHTGTTTSPPASGRSPARRRGPLEQAGRRHALPQRGNRREHAHARLRQARRALAHPARGSPRGHSLTDRRRGWNIQGGG